jgi:two-component system NtrC family sensor kinase
MTATVDNAVAELRQTIAELRRQLEEALQRETATAELLQVINASPSDLEPVFEAMLEKALRLCDAETGHLLRYENGVWSREASLGVPEDFDRLFPRGQPINHAPASPPNRMTATRTIIHVADMREDESYLTGAPTEVAGVQAGIRTALFVPLLKEGDVVGCFVMHRMEVRPFGDKQIALLENFAAQAVIAMENARLITETREALDQQTATAEVLQIINSSPGNLQPVFDAMLEKATRLCEGIQGVLWTIDGERVKVAATYQVPAEFVELLRQIERGQLNPFPQLRQIMQGERVVHNVDVAELNRAAYPLAKTAVESGRVRTLVAVALVKEGAAVGAFGIARREVRPFSDKQIALLQNFAAQAVIAMDNARLLNEIRQRQAELRVTFDNMGDGVAMFDGELRLAAWNKNFQEILDLTDEFVATHPSYAEYLRYNAKRGEFGEVDIEAEVARRLQAIDQDLRFEHTRPDGRIIEVRRDPVPGGGFVLINGDVTERKRSEAEIRAARDTAEAALKELQAAQASLLHAQKMAALGHLTAGIAHEIKNPLNFVNNFAGLSVELLDELKETTAPAVASLGEKTRAEIDEIVGMLTGNLAKIAEHGKRADGIVTSMLEHSRGSSSDRRSVDLNSLVEEALNLAYHGGRAQDQSFNVTLERDYAAAVAPIELTPQDITRVCLNLISNGFYAATKRQREGGDARFKPTLRVSTRDFGDAVEIRIRDNGIGIAPEFRDRLFQPFFTTKPTGEGTGLGLSISYDIVTQQHGGTITVDSRVGDFTEFTIRLPRIRLTTAEAVS